MSELNEEYSIAVVRLGGVFRWFRAPRQYWVLDYVRWRDAYVRLGHKVPELDESDRWGLHVVSEKNATKFLRLLSSFEISKDVLALELAKRFSAARNWWDVSDLFPIVFIDFDRCHLSAFYPHGTPMEKFVPTGWIGKFEDFATESSEEEFPEKEKFWIKGGADLLKMLNDRGRELS